MVHCPWRQDSFPADLNKPLPKSKTKLVDGSEVKDQGEENYNHTQQRC